MDDLKACIIGAFATMFFTCMVVWIVAEVRKGPGNRRTGLPQPRSDERSSIDQFRRIINP